MIETNFAGDPPVEIRDDQSLLTCMLADEAQADLSWRAAPYWQSYRDRIHRELARNGLAGMRTNQTLLKGFASGGMSQPLLPRAAWKRLIWRAVEATPGAARVVAENRRLLHVTHQRAIEAEIRSARLVLDRIAEEFPHMTPPEGLANGGAEDAFTWRGHMVTADWLPHLTRIADFYHAVPMGEVREILEIGPGLGLSTLAHVALNPGLRVVVNCDISPILYISTQFMKSIPGVDTVDYREVATGDALSQRTPNRPTIYKIPAWQLADLELQTDAFFNAFSFMEMSQNICRKYAAIVVRLPCNWILLHSLRAGHAPGAGGQEEPVTFAFLQRIFGEAFPVEFTLGTQWPTLYGSKRVGAVLLGRRAPQVDGQGGTRN